MVFAGKYATKINYKAIFQLETHYFFICNISVIGIVNKNVARQICFLMANNDRINDAGYNC